MQPETDSTPSEFQVNMYFYEWHEI